MIDLSDPISRQQTITALRALSDDDGYIYAPHEVVTDVVRGLPPVRAEHEQTTRPERGESDKLASKMGKTWVDVTCPNCGCEIHVEPEKREDTVSRNTIIQKLNTMDRYVSEELRLCDTDKKFPKNEVFIVDDVYEEIVEDLPPVKTERKTGKWIPVTERLPEEKQEVIVTVTRNNGSTFTERDGWTGTGFWGFGHRVIAWMPLPEPYQAERWKE